MCSMLRIVGCVVRDVENCEMCVCNLVFIIPLHAARRAMARTAGCVVRDVENYGGVKEVLPGMNARQAIPLCQVQSYPDKIAVCTRQFIKYWDT